MPRNVFNAAAHDAVERRRVAFDRLRAAGEEFLAALTEYDLSGDHLKHDVHGDCMRCDLLTVIGDKAP